MERIDTDSIVNFSDETAGDVEREARLLVCGDFPAKNLTVTEADLDSLVANFSAPVPVKVEHIDSPLDPLGIVSAIRREGQELIGTLKFPPDMASFLSKRGAAKLSIGLLKAPIWRLLECSLTLSPHVKGATLLSDTEKSELITLRQQLRKQTVDAQILELKATGRVVPATEAMARVMLSQSETVVTLSDGKETSAADQFFEYLKAQPPIVHLSETAKVKLAGGAAGAAGMTEEDDEDEPEFDDDDMEIMKRLGVDPKDVKTTMINDKKAKKMAERGRK